MGDNFVSVLGVFLGFRSKSSRCFFILEFVFVGVGVGRRRRSLGSDYGREGVFLFYCRDDIGR